MIALPAKGRIKDDEEQIIEEVKLDICTDDQLSYFEEPNSNFNGFMPYLRPTLLCPDFSEFKIQGSEFSPIYKRPKIRFDIPK